MGTVNGTDFVVRFIPLPLHIRAFTVVDNDGICNIYINQSMPHNRQVASFKHELAHIIRDDFCGRTDIRAVEA